MNGLPPLPDPSPKYDFLAVQANGRVSGQTMVLRILQPIARVIFVKVKCELVSSSGIYSQISYTEKYLSKILGGPAALHE